MRTIAIDLGLNLGIASHFVTAEGEEVFTSECVKINSKDFGIRLLAFEAEIKRYPCFEVEYVVEVPHGGYFAASKLLFGFLGILYRRAALYHLPVYEYSPASIKKHATNNGKADKQQMLEAANNLGIKKIANHNEADALLLLKYHLSKVNNASKE